MKNQKSHIQDLEKQSTTNQLDKPLIEACIKSLKPHGDVLEVRFGEFAAQAIQQFKPKSHTILENDKNALKHLKEWLNSHKNGSVKIVEAHWQDKLAHLGAFDAIFINDPLFRQSATTESVASEQFQELNKQAETTKNQLAAALKQFKGVRFSDAELMSFAEDISAQSSVSHDDVLNFVDDLVKMKNITEQQRAEFRRKFTKLASKKQEYSEDADISFEKEPTLAWVIANCLDKHLRPGARFVTYIETAHTLKNDPAFKDILTRKDAKYSEEFASVGNRKVLIITVEKK